MRGLIRDLLRDLWDEHRADAHHEDMCVTCRRAKGVLSEKPKRSVKAARVRRVQKKATKKEETAAIREAVMMRASGFCELCGRAMPVPLEMDHMLGRVRVEQSPENCWALCSWCHHQKTNNRPDATYWLRAMADFCNHNRFTETRDALMRRLGALELSARAASMTRGAENA